MFRKAAGLTLALAGLLGACQHDNSVEAQTSALRLTNDSLAQRQQQLRRFDTLDERNLLAAGAGVMQDLGFLIQETSARAGLIMADKDRDAVEAGQVAGQMFLALLISAMGGKADPIWDQTQKIRISLATRPSADKAAIVARVTFQRVIWNNKNQLSKLETIDDPKIYQEFFDRLSQSVFLQAHEI
jgi:hypothetical protein